jgi:hypothetical protein
MKEVQEKTFAPVFRCGGNMAIVLPSVKKPSAVKPAPVSAPKQYLRHGVFLTIAELREWDDK